MKQFTIWDGVFLLFLYFKLSETGPALTWWEAFSPYAAQVIYLIGETAWRAYGVGKRLEFIAWKIALRLRVRQARTRARREMQEVVESVKAARPASANPGRFQDPAKRGQ